VNRYLCMPDAEPDAPTSAVQQIRTRRENSDDERQTSQGECHLDCGDTVRLAPGAVLPSERLRRSRPIIGRCRVDVRCRSSLSLTLYASGAVCRRREIGLVEHYVTSEQSLFGFVATDRAADAKL
jgi:hypothetical protein